MKRFLTLLAFIAMTMLCEAQVTVTMEKDGGIYKIPCKVNGVKMKFIFDTGASMVSMSESMARFLLEGEYLSVSDIKGGGQSVLADGSIVNHAVITLRDIEIEGLHLHDILAVVIEGQNAPLLLGQTAIQELGSITIEGNKLIINYADNKRLSYEQITELYNQADNYIDNESYAAAIECLVRIDESVGLTEYGLYELCYCYVQNYQYEQCLQYCNKWIEKYDKIGDVSLKQLVYEKIGSAYQYGREDFNKALLWYQKEEALLNLKDYKGYEDEYWRRKRNCKIYIADCYYQLERYSEANNMYLDAISITIERMGYKDINIVNTMIIDGKMKDNVLGHIYDCYSDSLYGKGETNKGDLYKVYAALLGDEYALKFCNKYSLLEKYGLR